MPQRVKVTTDDGQSVILTLDDDQPPTPQAQGSAAGTAAAMTPIAGAGLSALANSPAVPPGMGALARAGSVGAGIYDAIKSGDPLRAAYGAAAAWPAGRGGFWLGKNLQAVAKPIASGLQKIAPLGAAQGVNDLAQMAEPNRKDIGFLGIGPSQPSDPNHPAVINAIVNLLKQKLGVGQ